MKTFIAFFSAAAVGLIPINARAIDITTPSVSFFVNDPGTSIPVCEVQTTTHMLRGTDNDFFFMNDSYFMGVTDVTGTIGVNNVGAPNPVQQRAVQVGVTAAGVGFIDRNDLTTPKYLTIWEGIEDPLSPGNFIPGAMLFQQQIPQAQILANCQGSNQPPTAVAGADQTAVVPGSTVTLNGTASSDPDNDPLTYSWTQISGPVVVLSGAGTATPSFTAPGGIGSTPLVFQLIVNDGTTSSAADTVTISVQDNVAAAQAAIASFLPVRANLLLAQQPDMQRRIDRLQQRRSSDGRVSREGQHALSVQNGQARLAGGLPSNDGNWALWAEGRFGDFEFGARQGNYSLVYAGVDYAVGDQLLVGLMGQFDRMDFDSSVTQGVIGGDGWMIGPYALIRMGGDVFLDLKALTGRSQNEIRPFGTYQDTFETGRTLLSASLVGEHELTRTWVLRTDASVHYLMESQRAYVDSLGTPIPGQDFDFGQVSLAPRLMRVSPLSRNWMIRTYGELRGLYTFGDTGGGFPDDGARLRGEVGADLLSGSGPRLSLSGYYDGLGVSDYRVTGLKLSGSLTF